MAEEGLDEVNSRPNYKKAANYYEKVLNLKRRFVQPFTNESADTVLRLARILQIKRTNTNLYRSFINFFSGSSLNLTNPELYRTIIRNVGNHIDNQRIINKARLYLAELLTGQDLNNPEIDELYNRILAEAQTDPQNVGADTLDQLYTARAALHESRQKKNRV
jgi:hypothetical protein